MAGTFGLKGVAVIEYIKGQVDHHRRETFLEEYRRMLTENGIVFDERYLA